MSNLDPSAIQAHEIPALLTEEKIRAQVQTLGQQITRDYSGEEITAICILKGSVIFYSDLIRQIQLSVNCEFLGLSSYGNEMSTSGEVRITQDITAPLAGKNLLVVEDIVDTGLTLAYLLNTLKQRQPKSVKVAALLQKPDALAVPDLKVDYLGFEIPNQFVVGYGLDFAQKFRNLPYVGVIKTE